MLCTLSKHEIYVIKELLDYLDESFNDNICSGDLSKTKAFLEKQENIDYTRVIQWIKQHGGYCDCEVLANIDDIINS